VNFIGSYNYALVALSVLIAMFASYAALDLAGRVTAAGGWTRAVWLLGGAGAMGTGIWSMHYRSPGSDASKTQLGLIGSWQSPAGQIAFDDYFRASAAVATRNRKRRAEGRTLP
jgi:hypothetical protein